MSSEEYLPYENFSLFDLQQLLKGKIREKVTVSSEEGKLFGGYLESYFKNCNINKPYRYFCDSVFYPSELDRLKKISKELSDGVDPDQPFKEHLRLKHSDAYYHL